ncbi:unnamed protein product [Lampetra fluviatilis]
MALPLWKMKSSVFKIYLIGAVVSLITLLLSLADRATQRRNDDGGEREEEAVDRRERPKRRREPRVVLPWLMMNHGGGSATLLLRGGEAIRPVATRASRRTRAS